MHGGHLVKHWAKTQTTVCLSSGEAELRGIGDGLAQAIGLQSIARDLGLKWDINMYTDAAAYHKRNKSKAQPGPSGARK